MNKGRTNEVSLNILSSELLDSSLLAVAHELKSPLCLIRQLSLFLEQQPADEQQVKDYLRQISATSERGLRLASDLVKAGRMDQLEFNLEPISPTEICTQVVQELGPYYRLHQQRLIVRTGYRRHYLAIAHADLLRSVLINFCDNALYYADKNRPIEISIAKQHRQDKIRIAVRDFGPRLPLDVWRGFKQRQVIAPRSLSSRPMSSGIGLYLASRFAETMEADVGAVSHSDGATFFIDLNVSHQLSLL